MRALVLVFLIGCGGTDEPMTTRQAACQHVCSCFSYSTATGESNCVTACAAQMGSKKLANNQQCFTCAVAASCSTVVAGTACTTECATP